MQGLQKGQAGKLIILERPLDGRGDESGGCQLGLYSVEGSVPGAVGKEAGNILVLPLWSWGPGLGKSLVHVLML